MGSVWRRLGTKVTVIEFLDRICPSLDGEIGSNFQKILAKQGIQFKLGTKVRVELGCDAQGLSTRPPHHAVNSVNLNPKPINPTNRWWARR